MARRGERGSEGEVDEKELQLGSDELLGQEEVSVERIVAQAADIRSFRLSTHPVRHISLSKPPVQRPTVVVPTPRAQHLSAGEPALAHDAAL